MQNTQIEKLSRIIIIGENQDEARGIVDALVSDYSISAVSSVTAAAERMRNETFNVIIYDFHEEGDDIDAIVKNLQQLSPLTPIIITGPMKDARLVVQAIKAGATDFLTKPLVAEKMRLAVNQAIENRSLKNEIDYLRRQQDVAYDYDRIIAESPSMKKVMVSIRRLAQTESTILMTGETGTGKSFLSGNIHFNSPRRRKPFIKVNCANIPETLLESELFGHEKGAFTGAVADQTGAFEAANGGTVFLDELGEYPPQLLDALRGPIEDGSVVVARQGATVEFPCQIQVVAATNPCPCGFEGDRTKACECNESMKARYRRRFSGPLLDRFDLQVDVPRLRVSELSGPRSEGSESVRERVTAARRRQFEERGRLNRELRRQDLDALVWTETALRRLSDAASGDRLTARGWDRVRRVARTIADLAGSVAVDGHHVDTALSMRVTL